MRITKSAVDGLAAGARDVFLWDSELRGFGVKVTPKGSKIYVAQYRLAGRTPKTRRFTIGKHGSPWTPAEARKEAERLLFQARAGTDPRAAKIEQHRQDVELAFGKYAEKFFSRPWAPPLATGNLRQRANLSQALARTSAERAPATVDFAQGYYSGF